MVVVKENEQLRVCIIKGQRLDLSVITGPETSTTLVRDLISRCWHQNPDKRPTFAGIHYVQSDSALFPVVDEFHCF